MRNESNNTEEAKALLEKEHQKQQILNEALAKRSAFDLRQDVAKVFFSYTQKQLVDGVSNEEEAALYGIEIVHDLLHNLSRIECH